MGTPTQISVEEYLHTSYRPDREYIDGEIWERNVGKWEHARVQSLLAIWFGANEPAWQVMVSTEQRVQVSSSKIRVPDLVVVTAGPQPDILQNPPILIVEILSPSDTYSDLEERTHDYMSMGVETVWIVDPQTRTGRMCMGDVWKIGNRLEVPGTRIHVDLPRIFEFLDKPNT